MLEYMNRVRANQHQKQAIDTKKSKIGVSKTEHKTAKSGKVKKLNTKMDHQNPPTSWKQKWGQLGSPKRVQIAATELQTQGKVTNVKSGSYKRGLDHSTEHSVYQKTDMIRGKGPTEEDELPCLEPMVEKSR